MNFLWIVSFALENCFVSAFWIFVFCCSFKYSKNEAARFQRSDGSIPGPKNVIIIAAILDAWHQELEEICAI